MKWYGITESQYTWLIEVALNLGTQGKSWSHHNRFSFSTFWILQGVIETTEIWLWRQGPSSL